MSQENYIAVAALADVPQSTPLKVEAGGQTILLCRSGAEIFAISAKCTHADESLECGRVRNGWIACPAHGARFDLETGEAMNPPAKDPIRTFPARIVGDQIEVAL